MAVAQQSPNFAIFSIKFMVKVTRSLDLLTLQRVSFFKYACKYEVSISNDSKVMTKV